MNAKEIALESLNIAQIFVFIQTIILFQKLLSCRMESSFSPREIVSELDKFIIGQNNAKKAVAVALRNRWRRKQLDDSLKEEIVPKNILMVGPTGVVKQKYHEDLPS